MKKVVVLLMCFLALSSNPTYAKREQIVLGTSIIDQVPNFPGKGKAPMRVPVIYRDGYLLSLPPSHPMYIINIVQDDDIVFTSEIPVGMAEFALPAYLSGEYTIQFISGNYCFLGNIILD
jgi:hypothetical protein